MPSRKWLVRAGFIAWSAASACAAIEAVLPNVPAPPPQPEPQPQVVIVPNRLEARLESPPAPPPQAAQPRSSQESQGIGVVRNFDDSESRVRAVNVRGIIVVGEQAEVIAEGQLGFVANQANAGAGVPPPALPAPALPVLPLVPPMPPAAPALVPLDAREFDAAAPALKLTDEQTGKIAALKQEIEQESERLNQAQEDARARYAAAGTAEERDAAAGEVLQTARDIRNGGPQSSFARGLRLILKPEQWLAYQAERLKKK